MNENTLSYDGFRAYAESYGVFQFDHPGVHSIRIVYFDGLGRRGARILCRSGQPAGEDRSRFLPAGRARPAILGNKRRRREE